MTETTYHQFANRCKKNVKATKLMRHHNEGRRKVPDVCFVDLIIALRRAGKAARSRLRLRWRYEVGEQKGARDLNKH